MAKIKKDDMFCCASCGLEVVVDEACDCDEQTLTCCCQPMKHISSSPGRPSKMPDKKIHARNAKSKTA